MSGGLVMVGGWHGLEFIGSEQRLLIFEPQAEAFAQLQANLGHYPNVELINAGAGAEEGVGVMNTAHPSHSSSLLIPHQSRPDITFEGTETVAITTLDKVMAGRKGFDVLRIDTQGYELEVLRGARKTLAQMKRIECEIHDPGTYPGAGSLHDIDSYLVPLGFVRTEFDVEGSDDLGDATYERAKP